MDRVNQSTLVPKPHLQESLVPRERTFIFTRSHWLLPAQTIFIICVLFSSLVLVNFLAMVYLYNSPLLFIVTAAILVISALTTAVKVLSEWYFHYYTITDRKISEIFYVPLAGHSANEVLLDRVKCTEVDVKGEGFINNLFGIGSVIVTFDRPTHQESFVFSFVNNAEEIRSLLTNQFGDTDQKETKIWHKIQDRTNRYYTTEEIFPKLSA